MPDFSIVIPFQTDHDERERIFRWLYRYYVALCPDAEVVIGEDDSTPLNRSRMRNNGVAKATTDTLIIIDADCLVGRGMIDATLEALRDGAACVQMRAITWLMHGGTRRILTCEPESFRDVQVSDIRFPNDDALSGMYFAITRENFARAGRFDERFIGWGYEDPAFLRAVKHRVGPIVRLDYPAYHLEHPHAIGDWFDNPRTAESERLLTEYPQ